MALFDFNLDPLFGGYTSKTHTLGEHLNRAGQGKLERLVADGNTDALERLGYDADTIERLKSSGIGFMDAALPAWRK